MTTTPSERRARRAPTTRRRDAALRGVTVRAARAGDAPALAALATELGYPSDTARIAPRLNGTAGERDDVVFVAAAEGGEIVGFVHAAEKRCW